MNNPNMIGRKIMISLVLVLPLLLPVFGAAATTTPEQVKEFVRAVYIEGVPYVQASEFAPEVALPVLRQILNTPAEERYWANAAVTIGMIGHDQGTNLLIDFITRREAKNKLNRDQTVAKTSAVMAMGYIVNKTGSRKALDFLKASIDPQAWRKRNLKWTGEFHRTGTERNNQLAMMAVLGLGVSGNSEAAQTLRSIKESPKTKQMSAIREALPEINTVAEEALKANESISREGIQRYYLKVQPKYAPGNGSIEARPGAEMEVVKPPVAGEVLKQPQAGEVLKQPQVGEVLPQLKAGQMIKLPQPGEIIK